MICAVVLAAGRSLRMGTQKLLLPVAGQPLIVRIADEFLRSPVDEIIVVTGADGAQIAEALTGRSVQIIANPHPEGDMLSSVRCGLRALPEGCHAAIISPGDQPWLTAELIAKLVEAFHRSDRGIVVPVSGQRRGHPLLLAARFREEVLCDFDGVGLRGLLDAHPGEIAEIAVESAHELEDMDTPADYRRLTGEAPAS